MTNILHIRYCTILKVIFAMMVQFKKKIHTCLHFILLFNKYTSINILSALGYLHSEQIYNNKISMAIQYNYPFKVFLLRVLCSILLYIICLDVAFSSYDNGFRLVVAMKNFWACSDVHVLFFVFVQKLYFFLCLIYIVEE